MSLAGVLAYFIGHGLVKEALFMIAGILLALAGGIDELRLRGRGRPLWPAGIAVHGGSAPGRCAVRDHGCGRQAHRHSGRRAR